MDFRLRFLFAPFAILFMSLALFQKLGVCGTPEASPTTPHAGSPTPPPAKDTPSSRIPALKLADRYAWLADKRFSGDQVLPIEARFAAPDGYTRVAVAERSFAAFLRTLPLRTDRTTVRSYANKPLSSPSASVVAMDVGERDLQECADTLIRLHAEYLWSSDQRDKLGYHFTSGDETRWSAWRAGERFVISGSSVKRVRNGKPNRSRAEFRRWLDTVFTYAGTRSLGLDSKSVAKQPLEVGDFFLDPGSPGHAVIVLDIAESTEGQRIALLGQGFMPAQELHVIRSPGPSVIDAVWFVLPEENGKLDTPSWRPFSRAQTHRFRVN